MELKVKVHLVYMSITCNRNYPISIINNNPYFYTILINNMVNNVKVIYALCEQWNCNILSKM